MNKYSIKYLFIIPSLSIKYNFHRWKPVDPPLAASEVRQMLSWWRHIDKCIAMKYLSITCHMHVMADLSTVSNWHFLRRSTFLDNLNLFIDSFSQLVELLFLCDVTDTFPVNIRPRLLSACLNSAAHHVTIFYFNKMAKVALYSLFLFICLLGELYYYVCFCMYNVKRINDNCENSRSEL